MPSPASSPDSPGSSSSDQTVPATSRDRQHAASPLDLDDALTPDPGTEDMYVVDDNKFAFAPGQLSKLLNPKSHAAFYALGGLAGLEKGLRTDRRSGLSADETVLDPDGAVAFEQVAPQGTPKYGARGDVAPVPDPGDATAKRAKSKPQSKKPPRDAQDKAAPPFADRKRVFGENRLPERKSKSLLELAWITYNDKVLILLTVAAVVSLALGLYQTFGVPHDAGQPRVEWVEGVAIIAAIVIVVVVGTLNDWQMERQFNKLSRKHEERAVKVVRSGKTVEVSVFDVVVGDVMHLDAGDLVPVDGVFIRGHGVVCDESSSTGESDPIKKTAGDAVFAALERAARGGRSDDVDHLDGLDPFIISGSKVNEGTGTFLVTAVGPNSSYGRITLAMQSENEVTPLQKKLNGLADWIAKVGGAASLALFVVLFVKFLVQLPRSDDSPSEKGQTFMRLFITAVTLLVVAVPEGLPLAVTLALAFATSRMMKDNNLVRVLKACETMGNATTICSDKTGTLTQNKMTVVATALGKAVSFGGTDPILDDDDGGDGGGEDEAESSRDLAPRRAPSDIPNVPPNDFVHGIGKELRRLLVEANAVNSTAFEGDVDGEQTFVGSRTEVALLTFCRDLLGAPPVHETRASADVVQVVPFDSKAKYMATVVRLGGSGKHRVYVKGASEILLQRCASVVSDAQPDDTIATEPLTERDADVFSRLISSYAGQTLRTIGLSYRDFDAWPPPEIGGGGADDDGELTAADFDAVHRDMTLVAVFGIKDPLRPEVVQAIDDCHRAGVSVRMVTGDNIVTGRAIAKECGIYTPWSGGLAMEGAAFRRKAGAELREIVPRLQVLARSSPEDKVLLVRTLKELGETVAVTGDGTNDAPALKIADIGFAMGVTGTEVAKEAAEIILLDDNFASIVKGISWGRAVGDSVKKFLQFQLTVNVTAMVLTFVSAVASGTEESVLNAVQLLWINLIMDTFAALALATDPPSPSVLDRKPERKSAPLVTLGMAKMIVGQALLQLVITFVLNFRGRQLLGYADTEGDVKRLKTLVFNTFVWLQICNELNNRRLDNKLNIFEGIWRNYFFLVINLLMIGGQVLIIFFGGEAFKVTRLDGREWTLSAGLGALSLPWGALIRLVPDVWIGACLPPFLRRRWAPETIDEEAGATTHKDEDDFRPPLRTYTFVRGQRVSTSYGGRGFRGYVREQKQRVLGKAQAARSSATEVLLPAGQAVSGRR